MRNRNAYARTYIFGFHYTRHGAAAAAAVVLPINSRVFTFRTYLQPFSTIDAKKYMFFFLKSRSHTLIFLGTFYLILK